MGTFTEGQKVRALTPAELMQKKFRILSMMRVHFSSHLNIQTFRDAIGLIIEEQPLMSTYIKEDKTDKQWYFYAGPKPEPINKIYSPVENLSAADTIYRKELNSHPDYSSQLFRSVLIPIQGGSAELAPTEFLFLFLIDHTISDGYSADAFLVRLFSLYDELISSKSSNDTPRLHPPIVARSIESFYDQRLKQTCPNDLAARDQADIDKFQPESILPYVTTKTCDTPVGTKPEIRTDFLVIGEEKFQLIKQSCLKLGIKVSHLFSALFLLSIRKITDQRKLNLAAKFAIDIRHLLYQTSDNGPECTDLTKQISDDTIAQQENQLFSLRASVYNGFFSLEEDNDIVKLALALEDTYNKVHNRPRLLSNVLALSATQRKRGAHLNTMISNMGQQKLKSNWEHCKIHQYFGHGVVLAPVIGIAMLGFDRRAAFTIYHVSPWIRTDQVSKLVSHFEHTLNHFPNMHLDANQKKQNNLQDINEAKHENAFLF